MINARKMQRRFKPPVEIKLILTHKLFAVFVYIIG